MKEAIDGRVRLDYIDHGTFTRFAEYLFGNDYNPAEALVVLGQPNDNEAAGAKTPNESEPVTDSTTTLAFSLMSYQSPRTMTGPFQRSTQSALQKLD